MSKKHKRKREHDKFRGLKQRLQAEGILGGRQVVIWFNEN